MYLKNAKIKVFGFIMSSEDTKILEFNQYQNSDQISSIIYVDLESMIQRIYGYKNHLQQK